MPDLLAPPENIPADAPRPYFVRAEGDVLPKVVIPKGVPPELKAWFLRAWEETLAIYAANPFERFHVCREPCGDLLCRPRPKQHEFAVARTPVQAAFAGNRFGKSSTLVAKALAQHAPAQLLPERLKPLKLATGSPVAGRLLCPSEQVMVDSLIPTLQMWCPASMLRGGSWNKAWDKAHNVLHFRDKGRMGVYTYKQDPTTMGSSALDYVGYDEPPPEAVRNECLARLIDRDGFEMFAMTPVNMVGGGIGWIYRTIYKRREHPDVTVVGGSGHDNPSIPKKALERILSQFPEEERRAREFGEFMHFGGMVYPGGFEHHLRKPPSPQELRGQDIVVGIDPGMKNAAFVWVALDRDARATVFDEVLLQEQTVPAYAKAIRATNAKWGLSKPLYVVDPSARNRFAGTEENVESLLMAEGIFCMPGNNPVEAGCQQVRKRLEDEALVFSEDCRGLRDEAEEYRLEDRPDGEFKVVKENDHRLDALRYALMARLWQPLRQQERAAERLGYVHDFEGPYRPGSPADDVGVMGAYS